MEREHTDLLLWVHWRHTDGGKRATESWLKIDALVVVQMFGSLWLNLALAACVSWSWNL